MASEKSMLLKKAEEFSDILAGYIKEYKCPECKSYALWLDKKIKGKLMVRCRKCGYAKPLATFAIDVMGFRKTADGYEISVPSFLGGEPKAVSLS